MATLDIYAAKVTEIVNEATGGEFDWKQVSDRDFEIAWQTRQSAEDYAAELLAGLSDTPPTPPSNATQEEEEGEGQEYTATCAFCDQVEEIGHAIELGWEPTYWAKSDDGTEHETGQPVCQDCASKRLLWDEKTQTYTLRPEFVRTTLYTSAPAAYDGFSTRTEATVGRDTRNGEPVRKVSIEQRDYGWQTARYGSGLCRFTTERTPLEMFVKFGDWVLD